MEHEIFMLTGKYKILYERLISTIDEKRIYSDPLHTLAFGTDASFYRLIPKLVIKADNEYEVSVILKACSELGTPVTFRAAGTSLSGQAITDSVMVLAGDGWKKFSISDEGKMITLQPGLTGGKVNSVLAPYGRKIGPDPASVNAAMIGGIAANNASGMCCGTAENSYKTVSGIRIVFSDGSILDTRNESDKEAFTHSHPQLIAEISSLSESAKNDHVLAERIRNKYKMKNTTGYSLNALIDFSDPFDIIEHLMIGSEGTLGFISEINYMTVPEYPFRASSLMIFPDTEKACKAVIRMKSTPVKAVELIDRTGLRSVESGEGMPQYLKSLNEYACALLVETAASSADELIRNILEIKKSIQKIPSLTEINFTDVPAEYEKLWKIRKGLFPSVGAMRKSGTTVIIEDVAFPILSLAEATLDLRSLLLKYGYPEAVIFGHALEGNLHFVFSQDFSTQNEIDRYSGLMTEVCSMVVTKYGGALKAEHGTGRNMAPFVEMEWGKDAYALMKDIKRIFDPLNIINPGVILNDDNNIHLKNFKPAPFEDEITGKCTECGFCEPSCVSADLTLTPRQRIVIHREINSLKLSGKEPHLAASLIKGFRYEGDETCATDGLCSLACPVKIDCGKLIKSIRAERAETNGRLAMWIANNMGFVTSAARVSLSTINFFHLIFGAKLMAPISKGLRYISNNKIPGWNPYMPSGARRIKQIEKTNNNSSRKVVYFPSCINRSMGVSKDHKDEKQVSEILTELMHKAGYEIIYPDNLNKLCCGMAFLSKGYTRAGMKKSQELRDELMKCSLNGQYPILCDMSPCLYTMKENIKDLKLYEPVEFILDHIIPHLKIAPLNETITVFPVCSMKKMGLDSKLIILARLCAREVVVPETNCCGFAGDRGFTYPELNKHGLRNLKGQLPSVVSHGFSNSRTCESGLSLHSGISYKSIAYLVNTVSTSKYLENSQ
jgi:D-lactate dehydrogenase